MRKTNTATASTNANLAGLLTPARIALDVAGTRPASVIGYVAGLLSGQLPGMGDGRISASTAEIFLGLWQRSQLNVPQIAPGVALLDARIASLKTSKAAIIRLAEPLQWVDEMPAIHTVIACIGPADQPRQHLDTIHMLRQHFANAARVATLAQVTTPESYLGQLSTTEQNNAFFVAFRRAA